MKLINAPYYIIVLITIIIMELFKVNANSNKICNFILDMPEVFQTLISACIAIWILILMLP